MLLNKDLTALGVEGKTSRSKSSRRNSLVTNAVIKERLNSSNDIVKEIPKWGLGIVSKAESNLVPSAANSKHKFEIEHLF